ncbi:MAG: response regulator transcription factor [Verrucomicrobiota bacterium]
MPITIAIVEDDLKTRENLQALLRERLEFTCLGVFSSGEAAIEGVPKLKPEVVLMDINLPKMSGVECTRQLKQLLPKINIIMLTVYDDSDRIFRALQMGASGYLLKRSPADEILQAIQDVQQGGAPMSNYIARKVVRSFQKNASGKTAENLSKRETEVLGYVARGYSNKEVAEALGLSVETIHAYLKNIYAKLHVRSRTEAVMKFLE